MPLTTTRRGPADPHRRSVLTGAAALGAAALLAGCSEHRETDGDKRALAGKRLRARAARDSAALLDRYEATLAAHAGLAGRLAPLRAEVALHARAFGAREKRATASAAPSASASPSSTASPTARTDVPKDEKGALGALADAERRTADARLAALADAPPELARLLASVAAAGAAHVYLLTEGS